jgi:uncharacterized membrane protein YecN with MAPEG domain
MMAFPTLTAAYAAIFAIVYLALAGWVVAGRGKYRAFHGDGGATALNRRIRAHANFNEYVPLLLIMTALLEGGGAASVTMHALLGTLVIARIMHPIGMVAPDKTIRQFIFRGLSAIATWIILLVTAILLLLRLA